MISQPAVPETALKRRKRDEAWAAKKATADAEAAAASKKNSEEIFKRAEKYVKEYRDQVRFGETRRARVTQTHRFSRHRRDAARPLRDASGQRREATDAGGSESDARDAALARWPRRRSAAPPRVSAGAPRTLALACLGLCGWWAQTPAESGFAARRCRVRDRAGLLDSPRSRVQRRLGRRAARVLKPPLPRSTTLPR